MKRWIALIMILCLSALCTPVLAEDAADSMTLYSINVGKADCHILRYGGYTYMIDTGTKDSWGAVSAALQSLSITRLDGVVVTHTDADHSGGAAALAASEVEIGAWYAPEYYTGCKPAKHPAVQAANADGQEVVWIKGGDTLPFGDGALKVLGPVEANADFENCNSAVLYASAAGGTILLTGDMEFPEEETLLSAGLIPACTVIKIANHGEEDATSEALLAAAQPKLAVISTSTEEEPDTPDPRVTGLLAIRGIETVQTQEAGSGVLTTIQNGDVRWEYVNDTLPALCTDVTITAKDAAEDSVTICASGTEPVDITGWYLYSERGGETFIFPEGTVLEPGMELTTGGAGTYQWADKNPLHNKKDDPVCLYDAYGRLIDRME